MMARKPSHILPEDIKNLGHIPGRGGTRKDGQRKYEYNWPSKYRRWDAQFSASNFVIALRDVLNSDLSKFGGMPGSPFDGKWTVRGVEMVLFMDGK